MIRYKTNVSLAEWIDQVIDAIKAEKALSKDPGYIIVSEIDIEDVQPIIADFKKQGFWVSEPVTTNKIAIVWDEKQLDGFLKSGYYFG